MATIVTLLPFFFCFFFVPQSAANSCYVSPCAAGGQPIRFPFRLIDQQPPSCGYSTDFDLSCNELKETILTLPSSGDFIVESISYTDQFMWINDRRQLHHQAVPWQEIHSSRLAFSVLAWPSRVHILQVQAPTCATVVVFHILPQQWQLRGYWCREPVNFDTTFRLLWCDYHSYGSSRKFFDELWCEADLARAWLWFLRIKW